MFFLWRKKCFAGVTHRLNVSILSRVLGFEPSLGFVRRKLFNTLLVGG